jgi:phenylacetic acid degradation operon negative regulatory protein
LGWNKSESMKAKTEEFLYLLLWSTDQLLRPTFRNLTDSFETWAYRNGLFQELARLERRHLLERLAKGPDERIYRLTEEGRLHALGGRDPEAQWSRSWDGAWRLIVFDMPAGQDTRRQRLWRYLRTRGFGCLQYSVWITPDPLEPERKILQGAEIDVQSLILLEARPCGGENDAQIVTAAWDLADLRQRYTIHSEILRQRPTGSIRDDAAARLVQHWAGAERATWLDAVSRDPLLPSRLLPAGYPGREAWRARVEALRAAREQLETFKVRSGARQSLLQL